MYGSKQPENNHPKTGLDHPPYHLSYSVHEGTSKNARNGARRDQCQLGFKKIQNFFYKEIEARRAKNNLKGLALIRNSPLNSRFSKNKKHHITKKQIPKIGRKKNRINVAPHKRQKLGAKDSNFESQKQKF